AHLMPEPITVPLLENAERPAARLPRLLHRIAVSLRAICLHRAAVQQVAIDHTFRAIEFDAIVHSALLRPAILDDSNAAAFELEDDYRVVLDFGTLRVQNALAVRHHAFRFRFVKHPARPLDAVTTHVHNRAAPGAAHVVEPVGVR